MKNIESDFLLDNTITYLNHGSFGACPKPVFDDYQQWQRKLEFEPVQFITKQSDVYLAASKTALATYLNCDKNDFVYTVNPSTAFNLVIKNLLLKSGDEVLTTNQEYGAMDRTWRYYCKKANAVYKQQAISLPLVSKEQFIEEFFKGPGKTVLKASEMVKELLIPKLLPNTGSAYYKLQRRLALDLPILGVSVLISLDKNKVACSDMLCTASPISSILHKMEEDQIVCKEVRIALGVAAPTPLRAVKAEALLRGKKLSDELLEEVAATASKEAQPRDSIRGEAWYRRDMIKVLVKRMAMKSIERVIQPEETIFSERLW